MRSILTLLSVVLVATATVVAQEPTIAESPAAESQESILRSTPQGVVEVVPSAEGDAIFMPRTLPDGTLNQLPNERICCPISVARHHVTLSAKRTYRCEGSQPVTLCVENPANCCVYAVELCVPCCCVGEPVLCSAECGLFGRGVVTYQWDCGLCAQIVFRARGDAVVSYRM